MNNKLVSIRRRRGGWIQVRTRFCAVYVRLGKGAVSGDYETEWERARGNAVARDFSGALDVYEVKLNNLIAIRKCTGNHVPNGSIGFHDLLVRTDDRLKEAKGDMPENTYESLVQRVHDLRMRLMVEVFKMPLPESRELKDSPPQPKPRRLLGVNQTYRRHRRVK